MTETINETSTLENVVSFGKGFVRGGLISTVVGIIPLHVYKKVTGKEPLDGDMGSKAYLAGNTVGAACVLIPGLILAGYLGEIYSPYA